MKKVNPMKKSLFVLLMSTSLVIPSFGFGLPTTTPTTTATSETDIVADVLLETMTGNLEQSRKSFEMSIDLLKASENINDTDGLNNEYLSAMLRLSDDIGVMADRIGEMADRIVQTEILIGEMADRIVVIAEMIISNNAQTQLNLLEAQKNFNNLLIALN